MAGTSEFSFGDQSVAAAYDAVLTPALFDPWASMLIEDYPDWEGRHVLDLATGTGILAHKIAKLVGSAGKVFGADINNEMLELARQRCSECDPQVEFIESPAHPLNMANESVDRVVCQQGYQFFPDKPAAAREMFRVLQGGGKLILTTWCPVSECEFFGRISEALNTVGQSELADMMRTPFDFMHELELRSSVGAAGFDNVDIRQLQKPFVVPEGIPYAIKIAYATPIGPKLRELSEENQTQFQEAFIELLEELSDDAGTMGRMVSNVLSADKPG